MPIDRVDARVGPLVFHDDFSDPLVDVDKGMRTVEHETINDDFVVQVLGRRPDKITVEGIVYDNQLFTADTLIESGELTVRTDRWRGKAVVTNVSTSFRREADPNTGRWAYDITIDLIEVERYAHTASYPGDPGPGGSGPEKLRQ